MIGLTVFSYVNILTVSAIDVKKEERAYHFVDVLADIEILYFVNGEDYEGREESHLRFSNNVQVEKQKHRIGFSLGSHSSYYYYYQNGSQINSISEFLNDDIKANLLYTTGKEISSGDIGLNQRDNSLLTLDTDNTLADITLGDQLVNHSANFLEFKSDFQTQSKFEKYERYLLDFDTKDYYDVKSEIKDPTFLLASTRNFKKTAYISLARKYRTIIRLSPPHSKNSRQTPKRLSNLELVLSLTINYTKVSTER